VAAALAFGATVAGPLWCTHWRHQLPADDNFDDNADDSRTLSHVHNTYSRTASCLFRAIACSWQCGVRGWSPLSWSSASSS
jgi:hypothetical protein